jgi:subtilisin family serine protease
MVHDPLTWRMKARCAALASISAAMAFAYLDGSAVHAQSIMRSPSINISSRIPSINPTVTTRVNPNIAGRIVTTGGRTPRISAAAVSAASRIGARSLPYVRYSPNLYPACSYAYRDSDGECRDQPLATLDGGGSGPPGKKTRNGSRGNASQTAALELSTNTGQIVAEIDSTLTDTQADALARRHGLARLQSQNFPLVGATIGLFRITDNRSVETVRRELANDTDFRLVQRNFRYLLQDQKAALTEGDPAQYALAKLRLPEAHTLAHGLNVLVAVIDSGIDLKQPELANAIAESFDALGSKEGPQVHGTGVAGAIAAHARLMGSAPAAKILAIRAFGRTPNGAESSTFVVLKGLDYAAAHGAQIVNMSFAGPKDALIERGIAAAAARGIVMVAASGNAGPKSPPLYPGANPNVIAVSATDAQDRLFAASNRGGYVALAAPGVDIFLPAPDDKYQMASGTSFSAAYVSGLVALMLERNPALKPDEVRAILTKTARDLGAPGRDDLFGAGEADAFAAVSAVTSAPSAPVTAASEPAAEKASDHQDAPAIRAVSPPSAAMASDRPAVVDANRPAAQ